MLDPSDRTVFTDALRAPAGFRLDQVVATTYTLDLVALLTLPLSFTLVSGDGINEAGRVDPVALLEALRRHADRISVFCQAGCIAAPSRGQLLFSYLEESVVETKARRNGGVFHPKVAVVRYIADLREMSEGAGRPDANAVKYRFLCGTRNLTFDRSWDTMLALDGDLIRDRPQVIRSNRPLSAFVRALPVLACRPLDAKRATEIGQIADELLRVQFQVPAGFSSYADDLVFWPIGLDEKDVWPFEGRTDRLLLVSPFVDRTFLDWAKKQGNLHAVISRPEELDCLPTTAFDDMAACYVLSDAAESDLREDEATQPQTRSGSAENSADEIAVEPSAPALRGLHAKFYVADCGWDARLWTGSANATKAAFSANVEFLVELRGRRAEIGIDSLLYQDSQKGHQDTRVRLRDMLVPYKRPELERKADEIEKRLERTIDQVRRQLVDARLTARCEPDNEGRTFGVRVESDQSAVDAFPAGVDCAIRPVSFGPDSAVRFTRICRQIASFKSLAFESLTAFFAVTVTASMKNRKLTQEFVLKLLLVGGPADRDARLLLAMLSNRERLLRYLLMLLEGADLDLQGGGNGKGGSWGDWSSLGSFGLPLLEPLLRTLAEDPSSLDHIERLIQDLEKTEEGRQLLPHELVMLWTAIRAARAAGAKPRRSTGHAAV